VRGGVGLARVRLHLGDLDRDEPVDGFVLQRAAEQFRGDLGRGAVEELAREQPVAGH
jgi:hypothetical protein